MGDDGSGVLSWCIEGDEHSGDFHGVINRKRHQITICGLTIDGAWVDNPTQVKKEFHANYQSLFLQQRSGWPVTDSCHFNTLRDSQIDFLQSLFTREEIKMVVRIVGP